MDTEFSLIAYPARMSEHVTWLTQEAFNRLSEELADREGARRQEITKRIEAAREEGDAKVADVMKRMFIFPKKTPP